MKLIVKVLLVLLILFIPLKILVEQDEMYPEHVSFTGQDLSILPTPKNPVFVGVEGATLETEEHTRLLQLQEKVFLIRYEDQRARVMDQRGEIGYIDREALQETAEIGVIERPQEGAFYEAYRDKREAFRNYKGVRGIYLPPSVYGDLSSVISEIKNSVINTVILDYKIADEVYFESQVVSELGLTLQPDAKKVEGVLAPLKEAGIRSIARIDVFRSPMYAEQHPSSAISEGGVPLVYQDLHWVSPYDREHWRYIVSLAKEALDGGFDEVQFDFVRFPMILVDNLDYKNTRDERRTEIVQKFLMYAQEEIRPYQSIVSANVAGRSTNYLDDEGVGLHFEAHSNVVDVISPMIFPAYYAQGNLGIDHPEAQGYELVRANIKQAQDRNRNLSTPALLRPWIQDFSQSITYDAVKIRDQIRALKDQGITEFMLWNDQGIYTWDAVRNLP